MTDRYITIAKVANDQDLRARVAACAAQQGQDTPEFWATQNALTWASSPGWAAAWDSAVVGGVENPGASDVVITDAQILSAVQLMLSRGEA